MRIATIYSKLALAALALGLAFAPQVAEAKGLKTKTSANAQKHATKSAKNKGMNAAAKKRKAPKRKAPKSGKGAN